MRLRSLVVSLGAVLLAACGARGELEVARSSSSGCVPSTEICDGLDNDCNGVIDDGDACLACPTAGYDGHFYAFCQDHRTWPDALAACQSIGMSLLSIDDAAEDDWVYGVEDGLSTEKAWMGLTDQAVEGTFVWANGDPVTYLNWHAGEPNGSTTENCGQINRYSPDHGWNDEPCDFTLHFICESL
jgi:hypothetical protein